MFRSLVFVGLAAFLVSCSPAIDPALQQKIDGFYARAPRRPYPGSDTFFKPMPYAEGQYVIHGVTEGERKSVMKTSIVGHQGDAWLIESYSLSASGETWVQMLVRGLEKAAAGSMEGIHILEVKVKHGEGGVEVLEGPALEMMRSVYRDMLGTFLVDLKGAVEGGAVEVPAGVFPRTVKITAQVRFLGTSFTSDAWYHSGVPINGLVKSVARNGTSVMELLDFGLRGAMRSF
ncbi:MAG: hypothetical protein QHI48_02080 [Bacteroidota bacterium]|nr:hypothetical protein [Bacteroidota bacterium]